MAIALVGGLTLLAFGLRFAGFHESLTGDELFAYDDVHGRSLASMIDYIAHNAESSPPLFFALAWVTAHLGDPTETIRWPSIVLGSATVPLMYMLGRRAIGMLAGFVAAALIALDPFAVWQGTEARPYEALMFFAVLSTLVLLMAIDSPTRWSWWWAAYAVSVSAVVLTHYTGVFVIVAQTLWALWAHRDRWRPILAASVGAFVLSGWWLPYYHVSYVQVYDALSVPLVPVQIARTLLQAWVGHPAFASTASLPGTGPTVAFLAIVGGAAMLWAITARQQRGRRQAGGRRLALVASLAVATPAGILVYSAFSHNLLLVRNLAASEPFALLAVAGLTTSLWSRSRALALGASAIVIATMAIGAVETRAPDAQRANFRAALAYINARASPSDTIIDGSLFPFIPGYESYIPGYFAHPYAVTTPGTAQAAAAWGRARSGARVFTVVEAFGLLAGYRPPRLGGPDPTCAHASKGRPAPRTCVALRASRTYPGLQPVVVSTYSGP